MKKILLILILILLFSCSERTKKNEYENKKLVQEFGSTVKKNSSKISEQKKHFNNFFNSLNRFKIESIDELSIEYHIKQLENFKIGKNTIKIFKKDSVSIDWIKINEDKFTIENLKTINPRLNGKNEKMFCKSLQNIKSYKFNNDEIIFLEFVSSPCSGLGCSVSDYLIYSVNYRKINLFGSFRTTNLSLYKFPFNKKLNYISTEYKGDFNGETPIHFISRIYSMDNKGLFKVERDKSGKEYYYEVTTFPKDSIKEFEYKINWFQK